MEVLVASTMGLLVTSLILSSSLAVRNVLGRDVARTRLNQNLRGSLDIMGVDIREAGEQLSAQFPAVEIEDGSNGSSDVLTVRRNLRAEVLPLCQQITQNSTVQEIVFASSSSADAGCVPSGQDHNYNVWKNYRVSGGGKVDAFVYDSTTKTGEFFEYAGESRTNQLYKLQRTGATPWTHTYPTTSSAIYLLEEWRYSRDGELLRVIQNRHDAEALDVAFGVTDFQVTAEMQDGTSSSFFTSSDSWTQLKAVGVRIVGSDHYAGRTITRTVRGEYCPRNVLSF